MKKLLIVSACALAMLAVFIKASRKPAPKPPGGDAVQYCAPTFDPAIANESDAPLLKGLGKWNYPVTTTSKKAALYFNQGLALMYGFNHGESARSFRTAIRLDSSFAMAYWGIAMVLGPNYNAALNPASLNDINEAVDNAVKYAGKTTAHEKALINALSKRFPRTETSDMTPYYEAYGKAMGEVYKQFPADAEVATIYADALMNIHPWNLWLKDGTAQPWTPEIIQLLEKTLAKWPNHPGAIHYYIHATEASKNTTGVIPFADRLQDAMPAAGHMVHMPSHIYIRTGEYHKGVVATEKANIADSTYVAQCKAQGAYPLLYYPHNIHFLAACAFFEGNAKKAIDASWLVSRKADREYLPTNVTVQHYYIIPYYVMVHFGKWDEILKLQHPGEQLKYPAAIWHYARGMAFAAKGNMERAEAEWEALKKFSEDESLKPILIWDMNSSLDVIRIALHTLKGELLAHNKKYEEAFAQFRSAIAIEDGLMYTEPPDWFFSVRQSLGHWLVKAGQYSEAEKVYKEDLSNFPENGWSLIGLYNSFEGQGKKAEAADARKRFEKAWQWADTEVKSSRVE